ncbi:helix-turn-helix domain-containing protein [Pseudoalteromonas sp. T1lg23B]|uniref:helix-turn-helix domain-containing protein n=1 Tax=Pseudoalteromonas sp. T1lg23B TaxID=2077097 RepID=UPI000CF72810|nr:helix-turn-helix domain-containing protein [Pseudoalteromonas sp. T1lg23B]
MSVVLSFDIYKPKYRIADYVQAIWCAKTNDTNRCVVERCLNGDGCMGILFNLSKSLHLDNQVLPTGILVQPISTQTHTIGIPAGSTVVGIRFQPGVSASLLGTNSCQSELISPVTSPHQILFQIYARLSDGQGNWANIALVYRWLCQHLTQPTPLPITLKKAIDALQSTLPKQQHNQIFNQRQIERQFKTWLGITPKHFHRIIRVRHTLDALKHHNHVSLAAIAQQLGYSDQAHMTRELKRIAHITPKKYQYVVNNQK